jgi:hypothetical protein
LFYDPADSTDDVAAVNAENLAFYRRRVLTSGWRVTAVRLSQLDASNNVIRKGRLIKIPPANGVGTYPVNADEQPWDAINLAIATAGGSRRAFLMRGIGSGVVGASGLYLAPPQFVAASALWASALKGNLGNVGSPTTVWALRTRTARATTFISNVATSPVVNVNLVINQTNPAIRVPIATVQAGNQVSIIGIIDMPGMNAQWKAVAVQLDPTNNQFNWVLLAPRRRVQIKAAYTQGGQATYWNWALDPITGFTIGDGASRRTGRPPATRRGRRSARRS